MLESDCIAVLDGKEVEIKRRLGAGGFGVVYEATYNNRRIALKQIHETARDKNAALRSFFAESSQDVVALKHPNIVRVLAVSSARSLEDGPCLAMEFVDGKTLQQLLDDPDEKFDYKRRAKAASEVASALEHIHHRGIVHLDLKPANVLTTIDGCCKLADFGCSQRINTTNKFRLVGTFAYWAPELIGGASPTEKADVYSFAICLWQIWTRETPYKLQNYQSVMYRVVNRKLRPHIPEGNEFDNRHRELMVASWSANPEERPPAASIVCTLKACMKEC